MSHQSDRLSQTAPGAVGGLGRRLVTVAAATALVAASMTVWSPAAGAQPAPTGASVDSEVYAALEAGGSTEFIVYLSETADLSSAADLTSRSARAQHVYAKLTTVARSSQAALRAELDERGVDYTSFWAVNSLLLEGDRELVDELAARPDVASIEANTEFELHQSADPDAVINAIEWNVADTGADHVWNVFNVRGERVTVASIDTGVEYTHSALVRQYRGRLNSGGFDHNYNWFDPAGVCPLPEPCDNNGHGTHVTGTMVGDDGGANQIGVAPRARWIAAKGCEFGSCSLASLLASGQWMLAPTDLNGLNPAPNRAPHVVNNSWGGAGGNTFYQGIITAWVAAGIFPVFSAGNSGPGCGTAGSPGDNIPAYAVGSYNINHNISGFSSRGPSGVDGVTIKPNVAAPGENVRSSLPGNNYGSFSGTSMAAPHVAGTVALIWAAAPAATLRDVAITRKIIDATAIDVNDLSCGGVPANNNVWGQGRLDAFNAVWLALSL